MKILVDFDDTIMDAKTQEPIPKAIVSIKAMQNMGDDVSILTSNPDLEFVANWLKENGLDLKVSNTKETADAYIDNKAIPFKGDWVAVLNELDGKVNEDKTAEEPEPKENTGAKGESTETMAEIEPPKSLGILEPKKNQLGILKTVPPKFNP